MQKTSSRFTPLVSLNITHDYFNADAGVCRAIEVGPTSQTVRRARQQGMAVLKRDDGFDLFASHRVPTGAPTGSPPAEGRQGAGPESAAPRPSPRAEAPFLFTLKLRDLDFALYTEMPADRLPGDPPLLLSDRGTQRTGDRSGLIVPDWSAPAGHGAEAERSACARTSNHFGLFELHLPSAAPTGPGCEPLAYELRFTARRTVWRYVVAARDGALAEDTLEIVDPAAASREASSDTAFERLADRRGLPDGRTAVTFVGRTAMPLRQRTGQRYALRGSPTGGDMRPRTLVDPLPVPSPRSIVFDVAACPAAPPDGARPPPAPWSDIYVFV